MTPGETVARLVALLEAREPFLHIRFGDGDVFFMSGTGPKLTGDGEEWTPRLQEQLLRAWVRVAATDLPLLLGDVETYLVSDGCETEWRVLLSILNAVREEADAEAGAPEMTNIEALRATVGAALPLYLAVAADPRRKVFVGPERLGGAALMLGATHLRVPLAVAHESAETTAYQVAQAGYEVALFAAGRGGKIAQGLLAVLDPNMTQIDVGSGLDILFGGVRRGTDLGHDPEEHRAAYRAAGLTVE